MSALFHFFDRVFDTLGHLFEGEHAPTAPRARPHAALFFIALVLVPCVLVLGWEWSPGVLGVLGLLGAVFCAAIYAAWTD